MLSKTNVTASVGNKAINKPVDVALIQDLSARAGYPGTTNGIVDGTLVDRIRAFQSQSGFVRADGMVSPHGPTLTRLLRIAGRFYAGPT